MASAVLAGVDPMLGLYANILGPIVGGALTGTALMVVSTTSGAALVAAQALPNGSETALFVMIILAGVFQILFGLMRLGRFTEFVSYSAMTGFVAGIAVILILSQLPNVTGHEVPGGSSVTKTIGLFTNLEKWSLSSVAVAVLTALIAVGLERTRIEKFSALLAIAVPSLLIKVLGLQGARTVASLGEIVRGLPRPSIPSFGDSLSVLTGAVSLAIIVVIQGAGVSQSVSEAGTRSQVSRDFIAQGAANIATGFFRGLPVGGSVGGTALGIAAGARGRWAGIFSGVWMAVIVVVFPDAIGQVAMASLGALLILGGLKSIKPSEVATIWRTGWSARLVIVTTFVGTLTLPIQAAVGLGVVLSAILALNQSSTDVSVVQLLVQPNGRIEERKPPARLKSHSATVLDVYGHLFFAGARTLQRLLPSPDHAREPVVVLRMRGRVNLGATLSEVLAEYADALRAVNGRLYLTGLSRGAYAHLVGTHRFRTTGPLRAYAATPVVGESLRKALADAESWLVSVEPDPETASRTRHTLPPPGARPE
jgi:SulP family sulfate permease